MISFWSTPVDKTSFIKDHSLPKLDDKSTSIALNRIQESTSQASTTATYTPIITEISYLLQLIQEVFCALFWDSEIKSPISEELSVAHTDSTHSMDDMLESRPASPERELSDSPTMDFDIIRWDESRRAQLDEAISISSPGPIIDEVIARPTWRTVLPPLSTARGALALIGRDPLQKLHGHIAKIEAGEILKPEERAAALQAYRSIDFVDIDSIVLKTILLIDNFHSEEDRGIAPNSRLSGAIGQAFVDAGIDSLDEVNALLIDAQITPLLTLPSRSSMENQISYVFNKESGKYEDFQYDSHRKLFYKEHNNLREQLANPRIPLRFVRLYLDQEKGGLFRMQREYFDAPASESKPFYFDRTEKSYYELRASGERAYVDDLPHYPNPTWGIA